MHKKHGENNMGICRNVRTVDNAQRGAHLCTYTNIAVSFYLFNSYSMRGSLLYIYSTSLGMLSVHREATKVAFMDVTAIKRQQNSIAEGTTLTGGAACIQGSIEDQSRAAFAHRRNCTLSWGKCSRQQNRVNILYEKISSRNSTYSCSGIRNNSKRLKPHLQLKQHILYRSE
jgi:hypothetical protein